MSDRSYDARRGSRMLHELRQVSPSERLETLAVVVRCYLDAQPSYSKQHRGLARFFGERLR